MPLAAQVANKYRNHAVGRYLQSKGVYTIPNVRWGDERTYTCDFLPEPLAFLGVERHSIVAVGSYGVVKTKDERRHFKAGLDAMLGWLEPEVVLVYGSTPEDLFGEFLDRSEFVKYPDWTSEKDKVCTGASLSLPVLAENSTLCCFPGARTVRRGAPEAQPEEEFAGSKGGLDG